MAQIEATGTPERPRHVVRLEPGERISLCRCFASEKFPVCDGAHKQIAGKGPVVVEAPTIAQPVLEVRREPVFGSPLSSQGGATGRGDD